MSKIVTFIFTVIFTAVQSTAYSAECTMMESEKPAMAMDCHTVEQLECPFMTLADCVQMDKQSINTPSHSLQKVDVTFVAYIPEEVVLPFTSHQNVNISRAPPKIGAQLTYLTTSRLRL